MYGFFLQINELPPIFKKMTTRYFIQLFIFISVFSGCVLRNDNKKGSTNTNFVEDTLLTKRIVCKFAIDSLKIKNYSRIKNDFLEKYIYLNDNFYNWATVKSHFSKKYSNQGLDSLRKKIIQTSEKYSQFYDIATIDLNDSCKLHIILHDYYLDKAIFALSINRNGKLNSTLKIAERIDTHKGYATDIRSILYDGNVIKVIENTWTGADISADIISSEDSPSVKVLIHFYKFDCDSIEELK